VRPGRRRTFDPSIPGHIAQDKLPVGIYWDRRHRTWYTLLTDEDGRRRRRNVARAEAKLSELVAAVEAARQAPARRPEDTPGTVAYVCALFHRSPAFRELAQTTQRGYGQCRGWAVAEPTALGPLGALQVDRLTPVIMRRLVDRIAEATPSKANAILRYLRRTWSWARERGHCKTNPAAGVKPVKERKQAKVPETSVLARAIADARERGARPRSAPGRVPPYLAIVIELAYLLRLRSIEVLDVTLAWETRAGIAVTRRKGSRGNVVTWSPRLRAVWQGALGVRGGDPGRQRRRHATARGGSPPDLGRGRRAAGHRGPAHGLAAVDAHGDRAGRRTGAERAVRLARRQAPRHHRHRPRRPARRPRGPHRRHGGALRPRPAGGEACGRRIIVRGVCTCRPVVASESAARP